MASAAEVIMTPVRTSSSSSNGNNASEALKSVNGEKNTLTSASSASVKTDQLSGRSEHDFSQQANGLSTRCLHSGSGSKNWAHSPIIPPIYMSTTYEVLDPTNAPYDYSRSGNPTRTQLEKILAKLESASYALAFSSGLGTLTTISYLLESGDHILCSDDVYGGTYRFLARCVSRMGIETSFVDSCGDLSAWTDNFRVGKTKLVWIETPTNPMMKVSNIQAVSKLIKTLDSKCIIVIDNTFMTPVFQSPLQLGADIVMHSCSKYISGHSDIIMGALMTNDKQLYERLSFLQNALGIVPAPFDCSQMIRSIKTLEIRVKQQVQNAAQVAAYLERHPNVERVLYPGLASHPQHELSKKQCTGFGAMISFQLRTISGKESVQLMNAVHLIHAAVSLGCVASLIEVPALMTHGVVPIETRQRLGITNNLVRMSVGVENVNDLIGDLEQALEIVYSEKQ